MKFSLAFACVLAVLAVVTADDRSAKLLDLNTDVQPDGFKYNYKVDNSIDVSQSGKLVNDKELRVEGSFTYVSPEGTPILVKYYSDALGYHPTVSQV